MLFKNDDEVPERLSYFYSYMYTRVLLIKAGQGKEGGNPSVELRSHSNYRAPARRKSGPLTLHYSTVASHICLVVVR